MQIGTYARHHEQLAEVLYFEPDFVDLRLDLNHTIKYNESRNLLRDAGVSCTLHLPSSPEWRPIDISKEIMPYIDIGAELDAEVVTFHSTLSSMFYDDDEIDAFIQSVPLACDVASERGMTLAIETLGMFYTELAVLFEHCDVNIALDLGHGQIMASRNRALELIQAFPEKIVIVNVHDNHGDKMMDEIQKLRAKGSVSGRDVRDIAVKYDTHLPIGEGVIDFAQIFAALKEKEYDGRFLMMSNNPLDFRNEKEKFLHLWLSA